MALITCYHDPLADIRFQDGALPHVIGACNYQVVRAAKNKEYSPEGKGFTYNHAPMLAYWQNHFWYEYLAGPSGEHETPSIVFLCRSRDGVHWEKPVEVFPACDIPAAPYRGPGKNQISGTRVPLVAHHRMGFYTTQDHRFLITSFYGICPNPHINPNNGFGVGRVVREIYPDYSMSPIYFLRYNTNGGYEREHVDIFAYYEESQDKGFVQACRELLSDRLVTQQWWEEEQLDDEFFTCKGGKALSYYTLPNGEIMGVFKDGLTSKSSDNGESWSKPVKSPSIITSTGKVWGQRMPDGNYALIYNPSPDGAHRWPLAVTTGENGQDFYNLAAIVPEIAPCRYEGVLKNLGAQYMRGITEANSRPDDMGVWIAYSVNKEDMWIARIPNPVETQWRGDVRDDMAVITQEELRNTWNLYVPSWGSAELTAIKGEQVLELIDRDLYNRVRAERIFEHSVTVEINLTIEVGGSLQDKAMVCVESRDGQRPLTLVFTDEGKLAVRAGGRDQEFGDYIRNEKMYCKISVDCRESIYQVSIEQKEKKFLKKGAASAAVRQVERMVAATKYYLPFQGLEVNGRDGTIGNLPGGDMPIESSVMRIHELYVTAQQLAGYKLKSI